MLEVSGLVSGHGEGTVLDGVSLSVAAGETLAVLGHTGAGKTTLLRTLMGLIRPRAGSIRLDGVDMTGRETFEIARAGLAYVPQGREIFAAFTVEENLRLADRGNTGIAEAYALFPVLRDMRARRAGNLSGGQQQQLAIARALMARPRVLLLDEPSEGVQPNIVAGIGDTVARVARERRLAVILVEQDIDLVRRMAQRVAFLQDGVIAATHPVAALADPAIIERHLGL
ncbi:MAG: ABC transporter ATP-binding protein [Labrys sp. (in: a-proteobacteria)]